jgi:hypothetical protein
MTLPVEDSSQYPEIEVMIFLAVLIISEHGEKLKKAALLAFMCFVAPLNRRRSRGLYHRFRFFGVMGLGRTK